jgi:uncharacterized membrane protein HdeD (DUF308 family)
MTPSSPPESTRGIAQLIAAKWWLLLLRALLLIALGLYALLQPGVTLLAYALVLGAFVLVDGVFTLIAAFSSWRETRGWTVLRALLSIGVGAAMVWNPALFGVVAAVTIVTIIAVIAIFNGAAEIVVAIRERKQINGEGWMIFGGVVSILFGGVLLMAPFVAAALFIQISGVFAIVFGLVAAFTALKLRRMKAQAG